MGRDCSETIKKLNELLTKYQNEKSENEKCTEEAEKKIKEYEQVIVSYENTNDWDMAQQCRNEKNRCLALKKNHDGNIVKYKLFISQCETLINSLNGKALEALEDIKILDDFIQKGCPQQECPEIRLIKNPLLLEIDKYRRILEVCTD